MLFGVLRSFNGQQVIWGAIKQNFLFHFEESPFFGPQNPKNPLFYFKKSPFLAPKTLKTYFFYFFFSENTTIIIVILFYK